MVETMPRKPRFFVPGYAAHLIQRGNNRSVMFFDHQDYDLYLVQLAEAAERFGCEIHAYVLMTNHVHLLATPEEQESISRMMQYVGRYYVPYINKKYGRTGTLWEGRFKASLVAESNYVLACYRYIELNPVRAGMVRFPGEYAWSSYRGNATARTDTLLAEHAAYTGLGSTRDLRLANYRKLFEQDLSTEQLLDLRQCLQSGTPYGSERCLSEVEQALNVKVGQKQRGRPIRGQSLKGSEPFIEKGSDPFKL
jgi:putative transposase